jgi:NADPH-dependent 2,4-dienoyl-CoA reductase/sulfur reductase-like enzyme/nitrite reductase/ring-hydroxylating ferredoxin subunit
MAGHDAPLAGPDLAAGVGESQVPGQGVLLGHARGEPVLLTRHEGQLFAVGASCPHYGAPLAEGIVAGGTIRCPWHHAAFDVTTGENVRPPARDDLPCWQVHVRDGVVRVGDKREGAHRRGTTPRERPESVVIVGAGAAGMYAAETLRREGYDGPVTLLEAGPDAPYDRPNLSKDYLAGTAPEEWISLRPQSFYAERGIDLVLGRRAVQLDVAGRRLQLDDGASHAFGVLLIATGANPVRLDFRDAGQRVHYLRTLADSRAIIDASRQATSAVVLGASFIGLEVAASLRARGLPVTVVAPEWHPMERVLGPELGDFIMSLHRDQGVDFRLGQTAAAISNLRVTTSQHDQLRADLVVAGVGVRPDVELAERAGLATDRGIVVDEYLQTSAPGVFAAGDVARYPDPFTGERIRVEHWVAAQRQGQTAARNILGAHERFDAVPFFWSKHYDVTINYVGHAERWDVMTIDGDLARRNATVSYVLGGRALATATIGRDEAALRAELAMERSLAPHPGVEVHA